MIRQALVHAALTLVLLGAGCNSSTNAPLPETSPPNPLEDPTVSNPNNTQKPSEPPPFPVSGALFGVTGGYSQRVVKYRLDSLKEELSFQSGGQVDFTGGLIVADQLGGCWVTTQRNELLHLVPNEAEKRLSIASRTYIGTRINSIIRAEGGIWIGTESSSTLRKPLRIVQVNDRGQIVSELNAQAPNTSGYSSGTIVDLAVKNGVIWALRTNAFGLLRFDIQSGRKLTDVPANGQTYYSYGYGFMKFVANTPWIANLYERRMRAVKVEGNRIDFSDEYALDLRPEEIQLIDTTGTELLFFGNRMALGRVHRVVPGSNQPSTDFDFVPNASANESSYAQSVSHQGTFSLVSLTSGNLSGSIMAIRFSDFQSKIVLRGAYFQKIAFSEF